MGTHQELEMFGSQPAYPEKLLHKKESLQNQLVNTGGAVSGNHGNPVLLPCAGEPPLPAWAPLVPALPEGKSKLSGRGINKALNAALQNGSKLPHPIESPPGSLASFPRATSVPGVVHDKVKLRATYFLGCFNSFAAHPFSPLSGEPGHWQHATLATS